MNTTITSQRRSFRRLLVAALALAALVPMTGIGPASAAATPDYGSSVRCKYHTNGNTNQSFTGQFRRIVVTPPEMFAKSGRQTMGWRFAVTRLIDDGSNSAWITTYTSKVQKAVATTTRAAAFDNMRVGVTVPTGDWSRTDVHYRITLTMFWYRANGTVQSKISYQVSSSYNYYVNGGWWDDSWDHCPGAVKQWVDGPF